MRPETNGHKTSVVDVLETGLPNSLEAEQLVLASAMISPELLSAVIATADVDDFFREKHRRIFNVILHLYQRGLHVDRITVAQELIQRGQLESVDGITYLTSLDDNMPILPNVDSYLRIIREKSILRKAIDGHQQAINQCLTSGDPSAELLSRSEAFLRALWDRAATSSEFSTVADLITEANGLESYLDRRRQNGVMTHLPRLNALTRGFQPGSLNILAAYTSRGKTALALNFAAHAAANGIGTSVFSLEMEKSELADRLLCIRGKVTSEDLFRSHKDILQRQAALDAVNLTAALPIFIRDKSATVPAIHAHVRRLQSRQGVGFVIVDYLQLLTPTGKAENRTNEVSAMTRGLKMAAQDLRVPFLVLSQFSRPKDHGSDKPPTLFDLRDSGSIEQDANTVLFLHSNQSFLEVEANVPIDTKLILAKQRNGPLGEIPLEFYRAYGRLEEKYT